MLKCTFLGNCGLLLETEEESVLVDCPNGFHRAYDRLTDEEFSRMLSRSGPYEKLKGLLFTHLHDDHYDPLRVAKLIELDNNLVLFAPTGDTPATGVLKVGGFTVRYYKVPHSGENLRDVPHRVLIVETAGRRVFVTGDSEWTEPLLAELALAYRMDCGILNPNFVSHEEGRRLIALMPRNYIYHYPVNMEDAFGIARKCNSRFLKHKEELQNVFLVDKLPFSVRI